MAAVSKETGYVVTSAFVITLSEDEAKALGRFVSRAGYEDMSTEDFRHHGDLWEALKAAGVTPY